MLAAVAAGRAQVGCSCEPDLYVDGCPVCDQFTAHQLFGRGLIRPTVCGAVGQRVPAELTVTGAGLLGAM